MTGLVINSIYACYTIFFGLQDFAGGWGSYDKESLKNLCIKDVKEMMGLKTYSHTPNDVQLFCECYSTIIPESFSKNEYLEFVQKPNDSTIFKSIQLIEPCLTKYDKIRELFLETLNVRQQRLKTHPHSNQ